MKAFLLALLFAALLAAPGSAAFAHGRVFIAAGPAAHFHSFARPMFRPRVFIAAAPFYYPPPVYYYRPAPPPVAYYCPDYRQYYPAVPYCPSGWLPVLVSGYASPY